MSAVRSQGRAACFNAPPMTFRAPRACVHCAKIADIPAAAITPQKNDPVMTPAASMSAGCLPLCIATPMMDALTSWPRPFSSSCSCNSSLGHPSRTSASGRFLPVATGRIRPNFAVADRQLRVDSGPSHPRPCRIRDSAKVVSRGQALYGQRHG